MKKITLFALLFSLYQIGEAQEKQIFNQNNRITIGYLGYKLQNPGFQLGIEKSFGEVNKHQIIKSLNVFYYNQKHLQSAIAINAKFGQRYTNKIGLNFETFFGMGVQYTTFTNYSFDFNGSQSVKSINKMSKWGVTPNITLGLGYDFFKKSNNPITVYARPSFYWLYPDKNNVLQTSSALEIGFIYPIH